MLKRFINEITTNHLCTREDSILLAVSGGVDSMVLAHLFHLAGYTMGIAHCNFQLRGKASDEDDDFVQTWCDQFNIPCHTKRFNTNNYAAENGLSIQMAARDLRYAWFAELMEEHAYTLLATAHHQNDNLETTLLNLVRGTGLSGLRGMPFKSNKIIRPLLNFTKEELVRFANESKIAWREDASNESSDYDRNYIRNEIIPRFLALNPSIEKSFGRTHQRLLASEALSQLGLEALKQEFILIDKNRIKIDKAFLMVTPFPVGVAWELIKSYGFNHSQCEEMVKASLESSGKRFLSHSHQLIVDRDAWLIEAHKARLDQVMIAAGQTEVSLGGMEMSIETGIYKSFPTDSMVAMLDLDRIRFPLIWRVWEQGDRFSPLGMQSQKKLSDFFIDYKLSLLDKQEATVVESDGEIVWVVGYRIDNRFKVTDQKKQTLKLSVKPHL